MTDHPDELRIEPIQKNHDCNTFDCGEKPLNDYLFRYAYKNDQNNISKTFVLLSNDNDVLGYYSICATSIEFAELPEEIAKKLPRYPIPCALLAKLAVTHSAQGNDYGGRLLIDALQRILQTSEQLGIKLIIVDALNEKAKAFYEHYEFIPFPGNELKLFLPIETIEQLPI